MTNDTMKSVTSLAELAKDFRERSQSLQELSKDSALTHAMAEVEARYGLVSRMERADQLSRRTGRIRTCCQADLNYMLAKILSEAGELAGAVENYFGRHDRLGIEAGNLASVQEEWGDVAVMLLRVATMFDIDPALAIDRSLAKYEQRLDEIEARRAATDSVPAAVARD